MSTNLHQRTASAFRFNTLSVGILLAFASAGALAETPLAADTASADNTTRLNEVQVKDKPWMWNIETKRAHLLPEVDGTKITVTKKSTVEKLDDIPTVIDNNLRNLFAHIPGVLVSEQQTPGQLNVNYRGIGNPQEGEYILSLQDGIRSSATGSASRPTITFRCRKASNRSSFCALDRDCCTARNPRY